MTLHRHIAPEDREVIKTLIKMSGHSSTSLSGMLGLSQPALSRWLAGESTIRHENIFSLLTTIGLQFKEGRIEFARPAYLWAAPTHLENRLQVLTAYFPVMAKSRFVLVTFADNLCLVIASQADEKLFVISLPKANVELTKYFSGQKLPQASLQHMSSIEAIQAPSEAIVDIFKQTTAQEINSEAANFPNLNDFDETSGVRWAKVIEALKHLGYTPDQIFELAIRDRKKSSAFTIDQRYEQATERMRNQIGNITI